MESSEPRSGDDENCGRTDTKKIDGQGIQLSRRQLLASGAAAGIASVSGCSGSSPGSGTTITLGALFPSSGAFGTIGQQMQKGAELSVDQLDPDGFDVNVVFRDTELAPDVGRRRAQELVQEEGADMITAAWSSAVGMAIHGYTRANDIPFTTYAATNRITGPKCAPYTFSCAWNATSQITGTLGFALENDLGSSVYQVVADYEWGQSHNRYLKNQMTSEYGIDLVGESFVPLGKGDFSDVIPSIRDADPDIVYWSVAGPDVVAAAKQAEEFGLLEDTVFVAPIITELDAEGIPQEIMAHENFITGNGWYWGLQTSTSQDFVESFRDSYDENPYSYAASAYQTIQTVVEALEEAGGSLEGDGLDAWREAMEDRQLAPQLWGKDERVRACDHRATVPYVVTRGLPPEEADRDRRKFFDVLFTPDNPEELLRSCGETGCNL